MVQPVRLDRSELRVRRGRKELLEHQGIKVELVILVSLVLQEMLEVLDRPDNQDLRDKLDCREILVLQAVQVNLGHPG